MTETCPICGHQFYPTLSDEVCDHYYIDALCNAAIRLDDQTPREAEEETPDQLAVPF